MFHVFKKNLSNKTKTKKLHNVLGKTNGNDNNDDGDDVGGADGVGVDGGDENIDDNDDKKNSVNMSKKLKINLKNPFASSKKKVDTNTSGADGNYQK